MNYNEWCKSNNCEHYAEWEYTDQDYYTNYRCTSCKLVGQSHDITEIAKDCPFKLPEEDV